MSGFDIGLFDDDGELRFVFPSLALAVMKKDELGWGEIYRIEIKRKMVGKQ